MHKIDIFFCAVVVHLLVNSRTHARTPKHTQTHICTDKNIQVITTHTDVSSQQIGNGIGKECQSEIRRQLSFVNRLILQM